MLRKCNCTRGVARYYKMLAKYVETTSFKAWDFDNAGKPVKKKKSLQFNMLTDSIEVLS